MEAVTRHAAKADPSRLNAPLQCGSDHSHRSPIYVRFLVELRLECGPRPGGVESYWTPGRLGSGAIVEGFLICVMRR